MKTVIIGGSGFIGTNLITQLHPSTDIINLDKNPSAKFPAYTRIVDIRDKENLDKNITDDVTSVVILAAEHRDDVRPVSLYYDVNVEGTRNVLEILTKRNIKNVIFTSSVAVYGLNMVNPDENSAINPFNDYGKSKWQAEQVLQSWQEQSPDRSVVIIRPTVVFGPGNKGNVYNLLNQILTGKFMMIGHGQNKKSMAYVDNVSGFISHSIEKAESGFHVYNYVDTPDLSVNDLLKFVERYLDKKLTSVRIPYTVGYSAAKCIDLLAWVANKKFSISSVRVKKFCATTQFSGKKMLASGYKPQVSIHDGLQATLDSISMEGEANVRNIKVITPSLYKIKEAR
jgi:GlcNAc-P-P-Und epimerase